jgi:hypothetical protein
MFSLENISTGALDQDPALNTRKSSASKLSTEPVAKPQAANDPLSLNNRKFIEDPQSRLNG